MKVMSKLSLVDTLGDFVGVCLQNVGKNSSVINSIEVRLSCHSLVFWYGKVTCLPYSQTQFYGHPLDMGTSLLQMEEKSTQN